MIIKKLSAKSFGKLKNINIELSKGMNIIYGPNESGKSTVQTFIKGMFYGLNKKGKKDEISEFEKYKPWDANEFAGIIEYETDGFFYRVGRNFITDKISICNEFWDDIADKFPVDKKKGNLFAEKHIGLSEKLFEQTMFIRQLETRINDDNKEIIDKLINLQETGQEDVSIKKAIEVLEDAIKEIGNERTSKKAINILESRVENLKEEKSQVTIIRNQVFQIEEQIKLKQEEKSKLIESIEHYKDIKQIIKKDNLLELYNKAKEYETKKENIENEVKRLQLYSEFPLEQEERLRQILLEINNYESMLFSKKQQLLELEQKIGDTVNEDDSGMNHDLYLALSEYEIIKSTKVELEEAKDKLADLDNCKSVGQGTIDIIEKLKKIAIQAKEIKLTVNKKEDTIEYTLEDFEDILFDYKKLKDYKKEMAKAESELAIIKHEINEKEKLYPKYKNYEKLSNIEETMLENKDIIESVSNSSQKTRRHMALQGISSLLFGLILIYGLYINQSEKLSFIAISLGFVGAIVSILALINSIAVLRLKPKNNNQSKQLLEMYKVVNAESHHQFIKNWNEYKELSSKIPSLKNSYEEKMESKQTVYLKYEELFLKISDVLDSFNIYHSEDISDAHILMLRQSFNTKAEENNSNNSANLIARIDEERSKLISKLEKSLSDTQVRYILEEIKSKDEIAISSDKIFNKLNLGDLENPYKKENEITQLEESINKLTNKLNQSNEKVKLILESYEIPHAEFINEENINLLKQKMQDMLKVSAQKLGLKTVKENLDAEISRMYDALDILGKEKKEILDISLTQDENEFFEGCKKSKNLKDLLTEKHRLNNMYDELLKGETSETLLQKLSQINSNKKIEINDVKMEHVEISIEELKDELKKLEEEIIQLNNQAENALKGRKELNQIDEEIQWLQNEKADLENKRNSLDVSLEVLKEAAKEVQRELSPKFQVEVSDIIYKITGGKYKEARANETMNINVVDPKTGQIVGVENLSSGTMEQFYLSLRIALSNVLCDNGQKLPLIIDEAFVQYDDIRIKNVLELLYELSNERQIIIFTCQNRELEVLRELGLYKKINLIEL